jgi:hypothetical protein
MNNPSDPHIVTPSNLEELIRAIQNAKKEHGPKLMYRGQRNCKWKINSSFSRGFNDPTIASMRHADTRHSEKAYYLSIQSFMNYFSSIKPTEELIRTLNGQGCPYFEYARHHQQNYLKAKIHDIEKLKLPGAPLIDFTYDELVALFFANFELDYTVEGWQPAFKYARTTDAVVYVVNYEAFEIFENFRAIFQTYKLADISNREFRQPCIIHPHGQINDFNDMKPKRQKAIYVVHIDSRYSIDEFLMQYEQGIGKKMHTKIIIPKTLFQECRDFLFNQNYSLNQLFPPEIQYRAQAIQRTFKAVLGATIPIGAV